MAIWDIAITIAGAVGIGFLIDRLSGGAVQTIVTKIIDFIQDIVNFLLDMMPRPLKLAIFLILFTVLGGVLYQYTVGAQYVCLEGDVNKVGFAEGIAANLWPPDKRPEGINDPEQGEFLKETNTSLDAVEAVGVAGSGVTSWRLERRSDWRYSQPDPIDPDLYTREDILYERNDYTIQGVTFNSLVYALVSQGDKISALWLNEIFRLNNYDFFQAWLGSDDLQLNYDICYDKLTETCTLRRTDKSSWSEFIDAELSADEPGEGCNQLGAYGSRVGRITYKLQDGVLVGQSTGDFVFNYPADELCKIAGDEQRQVANEPIHRALLGTVDNPSDHLEVLLRYKTNILGIERERLLPLYGVQYAAVMKDIKQSNNTFVNKLVQDPQNEQQRNENELRELFDNPQPHESEEGDLVTFACNDETEDEPYDTIMYLGGINVFDPKLMFLFIITSLIWGFYKSVNALD